jgi:hypothetical protein
MWADVNFIHLLSAEVGHVCVCLYYIIYMSILYISAVLELWYRYQLRYQRCFIYIYTALIKRELLTILSHKPLQNKLAL